MNGGPHSVIISEAQLRERVAALGREIAASASPQANLTLVAILAGSIVFLADLVRQLPLPMRIGLMWVSSYRGDATKPGEIASGAGTLPDLRNRDVLIVDDILDTGGTLRRVQQEVREREPRSVQTVVLLRKPGKANPPVDVDFVGFDIDDVFVVGYGLDHDGLYRNLPHIARLEAEAKSA